MKSKQHKSTKIVQCFSVTLILIICFAGQTESVQAISCGSVDAERLKSGLDEFEAVFIGEVIAVDYPDPDTVQNGVARYRVDRVFKGDVPEQFSMQASGWGDPFTGFTYLMFVHSMENPAFDSPEFAAGCRNSTVNQIDFDYAALLGNGYEPKAGNNIESTNQNQKGSFMNTATLLPIIIIPIAIGAFLLTRFMRGKNESQTCEHCGTSDITKINRETLDAATVEQHGGGLSGGGDIRLRIKEEITYRCNNCRKTTTKVVMNTN